MPQAIWSKIYGDDSTQEGRAVTTDASDDVFVAGSFGANLDFGGGPLVGLGQDIFLAKLDSTGGHLWSQRFGITDLTDVQYASDVAVDATGNVVLTGISYNTVDFGGGPLTNGGGGIFVAKFDATGAHQWSKLFDSGGSDPSVAVDAAGDVLVCGHSAVDVDFGGGMLSKLGGDDVILFKLDPSGGHLWSRRFGGSNDERGQDITLDSSGNVIISGHADGDIDFGGGTVVGSGPFAAKFDSSGGHLWSKLFGSGSDAIGNTSGDGVAVDSHDNVILTGSFVGAINFGGDDLSASSFDVFVAKLSADGTHVFSKAFGDNDVQMGSDVAADGDDNILLTGAMHSRTAFGQCPIESAGNNDIFLAKLDPSGAHRWSQRFGDDKSQADSRVTANSTGEVILVGSLLGSADFGSGTVSSVGGSSDVFIATFEP